MTQVELTDEERARYARLERDWIEYKERMNVLIKDLITRTREPNSVVYFVWRKLDGRIKIGTTTNLTRRVSTFRCNFGRVEVVATLPGGRAMEAELHRRFARAREFGEWFAPDVELVLWVARINPEGWRLTKGD